MPNEIPVDELQVGELLPAELTAIQNTRAQINQVLMEIGQLEVQKTMKMDQIAQVEAQGQQVVLKIRTRLGLGEGETLQITPDGKVRKLPPNVTQMRPQG